MYKDKLFATGITVWYGYGGSDGYGWWAKADFSDFGHCDRGSVHGEIKTKYADDLSFSIDTVKRDAEGMGIEFVGIGPQMRPFIFVTDGEKPDGWEEMIREQVERLGWRT